MTHSIICIFFVMSAVISICSATETTTTTVNWKTGDPKDTSKAFTEGVQNILKNIKETQILCFPKLAGEHKISNGNDLDLTVTLSHVRGEKLKNIRQEAIYIREDGKLYHIGYAESMEVVADFKLSGNLFGTDQPEVTGTVKKTVGTFHIHFTQTATEQDDGTLLVTGFEANSLSTFTFVVDWGLGNDQLNLFTVTDERGFPYPNGLARLNEIITANIGTNGYNIDLSTMFNDILKENTQAAECP